MTLGEGKRKVYMLLDEYSSGGEITRDADIENKMADFFDMAQKDLARICRIVRLHAIENDDDETEFSMPEDFQQMKTVWRNGKRYRGYRWKNGKIIIPDGAAVEIEYYANPATVDAETPDEYEFEIRDNAAQAMCFYVAAQQLIVDLVMDYSALWAIWLQMKQELQQQGECMFSGITNTLYR